MAKLPHQVAPLPLDDEDVATKAYSDSSGGGGGGYERCASFGIPFGSSTRTASLGVIIFDGSLVGLSVEINEAVTSGSVTVNVNIAGSNTLQAILNTTDDTYKVVTASAGTWSMGEGDLVLIEVVASGYQNAAFGQPDGLLVVNAAFVVS